MNEENSAKNVREPLPFLIVLEHLAHHDDDRMEHLLRVGVVGTPEPPLTAEIESDFYEWPRVKRIVASGGIALPPRLMNLFLFKCFGALWPDLDGTDIVQWPLYDATQWIQTQFLSEEANVLMTELRRHLTPGLTIDWNQCSAFLRLPCPFPNGPTHD
ncbi:MAG TPA: hypothetical protein VF624_03695 [Tepidisphaeraceae bacterium]|jgi:hypothetical protein